MKTKKGTVKIAVPFTVEAGADRIVDAVTDAMQQISRAIKLPKRIKVEGAKVTLL